MVVLISSPGSAAGDPIPTAQPVEPRSALISRRWVRAGSETGALWHTGCSFLASTEDGRASPFSPQRPAQVATGSRQRPRRFCGLSVQNASLARLGCLDLPSPGLPVPLSSALLCSPDPGRKIFTAHGGNSGPFTTMVDGCFLTTPASLCCH